MTEQSQPQNQEAKPRQIIIDEQGNLQIVGAWKVRELLTVAQMIAEAANEANLNFEAR